MSHYGNPMTDQIVAVDHAHAALLFALVMAQKPRKLLEIGMGSGKTADCPKSCGASTARASRW